MSVDSDLVDVEIMLDDLLATDIINPTACSS